MEERRLSRAAQASVFLPGIYSVFHRPEFGKAGAMDLGQRENTFLLVAGFSADSRFAAGASLGGKGVASRLGRKSVHHADARRSTRRLCFDDATRRVSGIRSRRDQLR